jgi:hypothetical protein
MPLTVSWPASCARLGSPPGSNQTNQGSIRPSRACRVSVRTRPVNVAGPGSEPGGRVASQGRSQAEFSRRTRSQVAPSRGRSGASTISPCCSVTGQR